VSDRNACFAAATARSTSAVPPMPSRAYGLAVAGSITSIDRSSAGSSHCPAM